MSAFAKSRQKAAPRNGFGRLLSLPRVLASLVIELSGPEKPERVLERMGVTDSTTLSVRREEGGKIRVSSTIWEDHKVIGRNEVLEIRNVDGRLYVARMLRFHNDWDPPIEAYDRLRGTASGGS